MIWEHALPVSLSLPIDVRRYPGAAVMAVFENLLPDNDAIRSRIAGRIGTEARDIYDSVAQAMARQRETVLIELAWGCVGGA